MTKPLSHKDFGSAIKGEFDRARFEDWKESVQSERQTLFSYKKINDLEKSQYYKYWRYLQSVDWKEKRLLVLERDGYVCQHCKVSSADDVHHKTYQNLFNEPLEELISLCKSCHLKEHERSERNTI